MPANIPYGNAFLVNTPALDQLGQRLYMDERQRQQQNINNAKALDDEFAKNVSGIRDADIPDLTKAYQEYKTATQSGMRKKGGVSPEEQMGILQKRANMYKTINESKAEKEREEMDAKRYSVKPDDFNDNAAELLVKGRQLPLSQKRAYKTIGQDGKETVIDLTNPENLRWQDKTNWQGILQKASGTLSQRGNPITKPLDNGLEFEETTYKGGNDPLKYYEGIVGAMNTPRASQSLASRYKFTPEEAQDITLKYEELKKTPAFKNAYPNVVDFPASSDMSEGARTAKLLAMTNALNNPPTPTTRRFTDKKAFGDYNRAENEAMRKRLARYTSDLIEGRTRRNPYNGLTYNNGNVLDIIGEVEPVEVTYKDGQWGSKKGLIKDGVVYDENNNPYTGKVTIKQGNVPAMVKSVLAKQKINLDNPLDDAEIISNGGTIEGLKHRNAGLVGRPEVEQFQRQYDQERKGEALNFGRTKAPSNTQPTKKAAPKKDPLGIL